MQLHPDYPVVSGSYRLTPNWTIDLPFEMNRRTEDSDLVLSRPGFTVWLAIWGNDHDESESERMGRIYSDISPQATDIDYQHRPVAGSTVIPLVRGPRRQSRLCPIRLRRLDDGASPDRLLL